MSLTDIFPLSRSRMEVLLEIYLSGEDYLRSLEKKTRINPSQLHRTLKSLHGQGIIFKQRKGREFFYSLSKTETDFLAPLLERYYKEKIVSKHPELKVLVKLIDNNQILTRICRKIYLFGSFAGGIITPKSDIDLLFVSSDKKEIARWCSEVSIILNKSISPLIYTPKDFRRELNKKEPLLSSIISKKRNRIILLSK